MAACEFELYWIALAGFAGLVIGTLTGWMFADMVAAVRAASRGSANDEPGDREVEHGPAADLDDPLQRRRLEELLRRNGGQP